MDRRVKFGNGEEILVSDLVLNNPKCMLLQCVVVRCPPRAEPVVMTLEERQNLLRCGNDLDTVGAEFTWRGLKRTKLPELFPRWGGELPNIPDTSEGQAEWTRNNPQLADTVLKSRKYDE